MMNIKEIDFIEPLNHEDYLTSVFITYLTISRFKLHFISLVTKLTNAEKIVFQPFNIEQL